MPTPKPAVLPPPPPPIPTVPSDAIALILSSEGLDQPGRWPGGQSGVSLGRGHDLRFDTPAEFRAAWSPHLSGPELVRLEPACGLVASPELCSQFVDIHVTPAQADEVFARIDLPRYTALTVSAFPNSAYLPPLAFGALVSLVFNRGAAMGSDAPTDRRREMRAIRNALAAWTESQRTAPSRFLAPLLYRISRQVRAMTHLWPPASGLRARREAEAQLIDRAATGPSAENPIHQPGSRVE